MLHRKGTKLQKLAQRQKKTLRRMMVDFLLKITINIASQESSIILGKNRTEYKLKKIIWDVKSFVTMHIKMKM